MLDAFRYGTPCNRLYYGHTSFNLIALLPTTGEFMSAVATEIRAFTASKFTAPAKFVEFCKNGGKPLGGLIGGRSVKGSMNVTFETSDPGSLEVLATVCEMGQAEVADAVAAATRAFHGTAGKGWQNTSIEERCRLAMKLVELCDRDRDVLLACEILDGGKVSELAEGDFTQIRECAEYFCRVAKGAEMGDSVAMQVADGVKGFTYREPWGVVAGIIPWNYPIVLTAWFMFPALLSGNCILIKPAEDTPLSALYIGKLAEEAGFPAGVINVLQVAVKSQASASLNIRACVTFHSPVHLALVNRSCALAINTALA